MPVQVLFEKMDLQNFQTHLKRLLSSLTYVSICLFTIAVIACNGKKTTPEKQHLRADSILTDARQRMEQYYEKEDSTVNYGPMLDTIIQNEQWLQSDSGKLILREAYYNRGYDFDDASNYIAARNDFEKMLLIAQQIGFRRPQQQFNLYNKLGSIYNMLGDVKRSLYFRKLQLEYSDAQQVLSFVVPTCINYGILYQDFKDTAAAIAILHKGLMAAKDDPYSMGKLCSTMAPIYAAKGRYDSALAYVALSDRYLESFDSKADTLSWIANNLQTRAIIAERTNDLYNAALFLEQAINATVKGEDSRRVREIGKLLLTFVRPGRIQRSHDKYITRALYTVCDFDTNNVHALPDRDKLYAENTIMEALDAKAEWMTNFFPEGQKEKYWHTAVDCYDLAFDVERKLLVSFFYDDSRIRMLNESRSRSAKAIRLCYALYTDTKNSEWIKKAYQFAERNKSFVLLESIKRNMAASQVMLHDSSVQLEQQLRADAAYAEARYAAAAAAGNKLQEASWGVIKKNAEEKWQRALAALSVTNTSYRNWMEKEMPADIKFTAKLIPDDSSAVIEYFIGDSSSYAFVILPGQQYKLIEIGNAHLASIDSFSLFFRDKNAITNAPDHYQQAGALVYKHWLKPCMEGFNGNYLLIIPDDKLSMLPFDALITAVKKDASLQNWNYLIKQYQISYAYSVTALLQQLEMKPGNLHIAGFAPLFTNQERGLSPLPFTAEEMHTLRDKGAAVYSGTAASLPRFREEVLRSGILHIASHARADSAGNIAAIEFADSTLLLNELYAMQVNASLVVLSACQTGIGKIEKSEGPMSLARCFYYAGTQQIITSLWNINDQSTAALLQEFYSKQSGSGYGEDLRRAKLRYLSSALTNDKYSPYYWAGLVHIGYPAMPTTASANNRWKWIAGILLALATLLLIKRKKPEGIRLL